MPPMKEASQIPCRPEPASSLRESGSGSNKKKSKGKSRVEPVWAASMLLGSRKAIQSFRPLDSTPAFGRAEALRAAVYGTETVG